MEESDRVAGRGIPLRPKGGATGRADPDHGPFVDRLHPLHVNFGSAQGDAFQRPQSLARRHGERAFFVVAICAFIVLPLLFSEAFPLTKAPMFARPLRQRRLYELSDASGTRLNNDLYGLRTNLNWYLEQFYAVKYPETVVPPPDRAPALARVIQHLRQVALQQRAVFPLHLTCIVLGAKGQTVGVVSSQTWLIEANPHKTASLAHATTQKAME